MHVFLRDNEVVQTRNLRERRMGSGNHILEKEEEGEEEAMPMWGRLEKERRLPKGTCSTNSR